MNWEERPRRCSDDLCCVVMGCPVDPLCKDRIFCPEYMLASAGTGNDTVVAVQAKQEPTASQLLLITVPWLLGRLPGAGIQPHQPLRPTAQHCLMVRALPALHSRRQQPPLRSKPTPSSVTKHKDSNSLRRHTTFGCHHQASAPKRYVARKPVERVPSA